MFLIRSDKYLSRAMVVITTAMAFFILQGCFLVSDEAHDEMRSAGNAQYAADSDEKSPQIVAEDNVEEYVRKKFGAKVVYKIYNFGQLYRLKKSQERELDQLRESRALVPNMTEHYGPKKDSVLRQYDTLIAQKEREIRQKRITSDYIISHIFTIKKENGSGTVYEGNFILNDSLRVIDFRMSMAAELAKDDFEWFYYFFKKFPVFNTGDYDRDVEMSNNLYDYYNARLSQLERGKEELLLTALRATRIVNKVKKYDKDVICAFVLMKRLEENKICENYKPVISTPAEEIKVKTATGDSLIGYKIFHKFECTGSNGKTETKAVYAEMDPYFVPAGILDVPAPFDQYFEKK